TSLPEFYEVFLDFPWLRVYTLNVDDLAAAASVKFKLQRQIMMISATIDRGEQIPAGRSERPALEIVHLNGLIGGTLETMTFSETQYAERIASREPWYSRCVADLTTRPVVFVGSELRESLLWEHLALRKQRTQTRIDRRPASLLVTPELSPARQELLREL